MTSDHQNQLLKLFAACSQQKLEEAEHHELQAVLRADGEARKLWFLYQDLEVGLNCLSQVPERSTCHLRGSAPISTHSASENVQTGIHLPFSSTDLSKGFWSRRRSSVISAVALACLSALVMFGVSAWNRPPGSDGMAVNKFADNRFHNFIVESPTHGTIFSLSDQKGKPIALHFLLKSECPFCLKLAHDYSQLSDSNPNVVHLFLKPDSADEIKVWAGKISHEGLRNPPVIYHDRDAQLANEFGIPDGYEFHGHTVHYPALVVLDSSGKELFRYVGKSNADRMKPDDFIARLAMATHQ